jgi:MarR family transcriptional regulator, 2-MHQ and catechol-resistance regulon repressor
MDDAQVAEALRAYVKLLRAGRAVLARVEPRLAQAGLTPTQLGVLEAILHKGPLTQRDLGRKVLTSAGNMTDVVDKLEARGLVRRTRSPRDRRIAVVALTQTGEALIQGLFPRHARDIAAAMSGLSGTELRTLGALLRKLGRAAAGEDPPLAPGPATHHLGDQSFDGECSHPRKKESWR